MAAQREPAARKTATPRKAPARKAPARKAPARSQADALEARSLPKGHTKTGPKMGLIAERERQIFDMRVHGRATFQQIGDALGMTKSAVAKAYWRVMQATPSPDVEAVRQEEEQALDLAMRAALEVLRSRTPAFAQNGRQLFAEVPRRDNPEETERVPVWDNGPRLQAAAIIVRVSESRRKLHGADPAARYEVTGRDGGPVRIEAISRAREGLEAMRVARANAGAIEAATRDSATG